MQLSATKKLVFCAICVALCVVLPMAFHALGSGTVFLPMHVPVLLCGLVCTWPYGVVCGLLGPLLSSVLTSMPPTAILPSMMAELAVYGLVTALVMRLVHTGRLYGDLYIALCCAIPCGRIVAGEGIDLPRRQLVHGSVGFRPHSDLVARHPHPAGSAAHTGGGPDQGPAGAAPLLKFL